MTTHVKWNDSEIRNPIIAAFGIPLVIVVFAALTPFHPIFRLFGRKGFYRGNGEFTLDHTSFERRA